jgi:protein-tyrosine phosphatase
MFGVPAMARTSEAMNAPRKLPWPAAVARTLLQPDLRRDAFYEWRRRLTGEPPLPAGPIRTVLLICQGNICRSPFAERRLARHSPNLEVKSAGLDTRAGSPAPQGAIRTAQRFGVDLGDHAARSLDLEPELLRWADLIVGMQGRHTTQLSRNWGIAPGKIRLLGDFLPSPPHAIDDPWGESDDVFAAAFARIEDAVQRLAKAIQSR